jgi:hypothetical protein
MNSVEKRLFNLVEMKIYEVRLPTYNLCKSYSVLIKSRKMETRHQTGFLVGNETFVIQWVTSKPRISSGRFMRVEIFSVYLCSRERS